MDYELQSKLLIDALKEAEGNRAVRMPEARMQGQYAMLPGMGNTLAAAFDRAYGNFQKPRLEQQMLELRGQERGDYDRLLKELTTPGTKQVQSHVGAEGPLQEPVTENVPLSPLDESRRRLGVYAQMSRLPMARGMADKGIASEVDMPERMALRDQQTAAAAELARQRAEDMARLDRQRAEDRSMEREKDRALRMTIAQMTENSRGANADLQRELLQGRIDAQNEKGEAAKAKRDASAKTINEGRQNVTMLLNGMESDLDRLNELGGIVNTESNAWDNVGSRVQGSKLGQFMGGTFGTEEQTIRDNQNAARGQLLLELKNAKNLPAAMMNSNMELQRQLQNLGDGPVSYQTMKKIIKDSRVLLNANYQNEAAAAGGGGSPPAAPPPAPSGAGKAPAADLANFEQYYNALPVGTRYIDPNGNPKIKGQR